VISGLSDGTSYSFTIAAKNAIGTGPASTQTGQATPQTPSPPYQVTTLSASFSAGQYSVAWVVPPDNGSPITSFQIEPVVEDSTGGGATIPAGAPGSPTDPTPGAHDHTVVDSVGLGKYQAYQFLVTAGNAVGATNDLTVLSNEAVGELENTPSDVNFGSGRLGDIYDTFDIQIGNYATEPDTVSGFTFGGADPNDFAETSDCGTLQPNATCALSVSFLPGALGPRSATITPIDTRGSETAITLEGTGTEGYREATASGTVFNYGDADDEGDLTGTQLNSPIITMVSTVDGYGYWLVGADGGIFSFGDAPFYGSTGNIKLNKPIVGMAVTPDGGGYWMVASDGGIFSYGDAPFYGSTGNITLNKPIVGMAATPDGGGYWLVATDGGIFSYGDAGFYGSTGAISLNRPIVGMATTPDGNGYWLMGSDGGIFNFGDAPFDGSAAGQTSSPVVGFAGTAPPTLQSIFGVPADRDHFEAPDLKSRVLNRK
jgi:hypothetical protein